MGVTSHYLPSGTIHEYTGQIDFRLSPRNKWRVWTLIKLKDDEEITRDFMGRKLGECFSMGVHPISSNQRIMLEFAPKDVPMDVPVMRRDLLRFLTARKLPIIWKEGRHGYQINRSGTIDRKWKLNTSWSVPRRDLD